MLGLIFLKEPVMASGIQFKFIHHFSRDQSSVQEPEVALVEELVWLSMFRHYLVEEVRDDFMPLNQITVFTCSEKIGLNSVLEK